MAINTKGYRRLTLESLNDLGCVNILEAFLKELGEEYRIAYYFYVKNKDNPDAKIHYNKLRSLFLSSHFHNLTGLNGIEILESLDRALKKYYHIS